MNAVVVDTGLDSEALEQVRSLTRCCAVLVTAGTRLEGLPVEGEPLQSGVLDALLAETAEYQERITVAVKAHKTRTGTKTATAPRFPMQPNAESYDFAADAAADRAFALANYTGKVWSTWLRTDEERRRRTVQPRTGVTPWVMPEDMNDQEAPDFPPQFAAHVIEQSLV